jgi:integrase
MANIARRPDGTWRPRYRDAEGKEHARHFARKADAQRWLDEVTATVVTGMYVDPKAGRVTLSAFYATWAARQVWAPGTELAMSLAVRCATFRDVELRSLRRSHVEQWVKTMVAAGLAPGTVHTRVQNVRSVLRGAVRDRLIAADPSEGVPLPRRRRRAQAMTIPTPAQVGSLLAAADERFATFITLCAFAGLRLGEAAAVQVDDIDFLRRRLVVRRQVQRGTGGTIELRAPKHGSERTVTLPDSLLELLAAHIEHHVKDDDPDAWLFRTPTGTPPHQNTVGHQWRKATRASGLGGMRLHDLRHFYASGLIASGCDVVTVQRALGHASANTTLATYSHLWPDADDRTRAAVAHLMAAALQDRADLVRTNVSPQASDLRK